MIHSTLTGYGHTKHGAEVKAIDYCYNEATGNVILLAVKLKPNQPRIIVSSVSWFVWE